MKGLYDVIASDIARDDLEGARVRLVASDSWTPAEALIDRGPFLGKVEGFREYVADVFIQLRARPASGQPVPHPEPGHRQHQRGGAHQPAAGERRVGNAGKQVEALGLTPDGLGHEPAGQPGGGDAVA